MEKSILFCLYAGILDIHFLTNFKVSPIIKLLMFCLSSYVYEDLIVLLFVWNDACDMSSIFCCVNATII